MHKRMVNECFINLSLTIGNIESRKIELWRKDRHGRICYMMANKKHIKHNKNNKNIFCYVALGKTFKCSMMYMCAISNLSDQYQLLYDIMFGLKIRQNIFVFTNCSWQWNRIKADWYDILSYTKKPVANCFIN